MNNIARLMLAPIAAFAFAASAALCFAAPVLPAPPNSFVLDDAGVLSPETEATIEQEIATLEKETSTQIAVATVVSLQNYAIEDFAIALARAWGIGQKESDNGVLLLIAPTERRVRIEVGYGLEGVIPDAAAWSIIDDTMTPLLAAGDYDTAMLEGVAALDARARGETFTPPKQDSDAMSSALNVFGPLLIFLLFLLGRWLGSTKSWWLGGVLGAGIGVFVAGLIGLGIGAALGLLVDFVLSKLLFGKMRPDGHGGWWLGPPMGGGGTRGGFGGFGGGGFGGGGSSGSY